MRPVCLLVTGAFLVTIGCVSQELTQMSSKWDQWIGGTKDDRVHELGIPNKCHSFKAGGEVCEWNMPIEGGRIETFGMTFDAKGFACQWTYRGFYGEQKSLAKCS
ncbi:MAG: hypothetical protein ACT4OO_05805 [Nitrospiraceae bacterium]